jgi:hypothetical protein
MFTNNRPNNTPLQNRKIKTLQKNHLVLKVKDYLSVH